MSKKINESMLLAEENQKESKAYLQEIEKIENIKKQLLSKKATANQEIARLKLEIAQLDKEYLFETDQEKIRELAAKKKDLRYEIEEYESIKNTKYNPVIKDMLKEIEHYQDKATKENDKFINGVIELEKQYREELEVYTSAIEDKLDNLDKLKHQHAFTQAYNKYMNMKMDKFDW